MRIFTPALAADLARTDGSGPVWLLRFTAAGTDYILCQDAINIPPWSKTALPWIASWGKLTEGVTSTLSDFNISSLSVNMINDPNATPNLRSLAKARALNGLAVSVYLWVDGCTDEPFEMFSFMIIDIDLPDEASVNIEMQDESARHENFYPGTVITKEAYPKADPDDIGKIIPLVFGTIKKLTTLSVDAGIVTTLPLGISATATLIAVSDASNFYTGMLFSCDDEDMRVDTIDNVVLTVTRGMNLTTPAIHQKGAAVVEIRTNDFVYIVADSPLQAISKVWGKIGDKLLDITSIAATYTGAPDNQLSGFAGQAVVTIPGLITITQAVALGAVITGDITPGVFPTLSGLIQSVGVTALGGNIADYNIVDYQPTDPTHQHTGTSSITQAATNCPVGPISYTASGQYISATFPALAGTRYAVTYTVTIHRINIPGLNPAGVTIKVGGVTYISNLAELQNTANGSSITFTFSVNSAQFASNQVDINIDQSSYSNDGISDWTISGASRSISYAATTNSVSTGVTKTSAVKTFANNGSLSIASERLYDNGSLDVTGGTLPTIGSTGVSLTGNSVANTLIGDAILVDVVSPITAPQDVITKILGATCNKIGTFPAGYAFNGAITSSRRAPEWCHELARQCRSYFKWILGQPTLIVRPDVLTPVKSINEIRLNNGMMIHGQRQTDINDVINTINLRYDRDWSSTSSGDEVYQQVSAGTDSASITTYGVRERPELFRFDFVTSPTMAASLTAFYLSWYAWQRWQHTQECYLFEAALEFGDAVTLAYLEGEIGECTEVGFSPGNGTSIDKIQLTIIE